MARLIIGMLGIRLATLGGVVYWLLSDRLTMTLGTFTVKAAVLPVMLKTYSKAWHQSRLFDQLLRSLKDFS